MIVPKDRADVDGIARAFTGPMIPSWCFWWRLGSMPRLRLALDGMAFTFRTREEAEKRVRIGGTCFLVIKPSGATFGGSELCVPYLITNRHVVYSGGASVVSINRRDGSPPDILEYEPTDWVTHPDGDDLAAIIPEKYDLIPGRHRLTAIRTDWLLTPEKMRVEDIGVGDDVFMVGRFVNHQGRRENRASARFGTISMMQEDIWVKDDNRHQESFAVEMRSRTGFSGSPVSVCRVATVFGPDGRSMGVTNFFGVLGVNWGFILDEETGENTWLNGVVPAWKILSLLEAPALKQKHEKRAAELKTFASRGEVVQSFAAESDDPPATDANPNHREDFNLLVGAAARKREQED
jgi:hypothetical protein